MINKNLIIATGLAVLFVAIFLVVPDIIADENIRDYVVAGPGTTTSTSSPTTASEDPATTSTPATSTSSTTSSATSWTSTTSSTSSTTSSATSWTSTTSSTWSSTSSGTTTSPYGYSPTTQSPGGPGIYIPPVTGDPMFPGDGGSDDDNEESYDVGCVGEHCLPVGTGDPGIFEEGEIDNPLITDENRESEKQARAQGLCLALMSCDNEFTSNKCTCGVGGATVDSNAPLTIYDISAKVYPSNSNPRHKTTIELKFHTNKPAAVSASYQQGQKQNSNERVYKTKPNNQKNTSHTIVIGALPNAQIFNFAIQAATESEKSATKPVAVKTLHPYDSLWSLILKYLKIDL